MIHICPVEISVLMMMVDYLTVTYHYYICNFKIRFLGAAEHDLNNHYTDDE